MAAVTESKPIDSTQRDLSDSPTSEKRALDYNEHGYISQGGFVTDDASLPKGYYRSMSFIGTMLAVGLGLMAAVAGFAFPAPILSVINKDVGPNASYVWIGLVYTLTLAIGLLLVGRLSDLFGRRWFFIGASFFGLIGCIVCATAKNVPSLIGGTTLIGLGASGQQQFAIVIGELVPMKHRLMANGYIYLWCIPLSSFAPVVANSLILHTAAGWRWCYYILIIVNILSGTCYFLFYHPPTFEMKWRNKTKMQQVKDTDFVGIVLFAGGLFVFLLGISWGGVVHPWKSGAVISTIIIGFLALVAFVLYEIFMPLKEPLVPMRLFLIPGFAATAVLLGLGASIYYAFSIVWPQMVATVYTEDTIYGGLLDSIIGCGITLGIVTGGVTARAIGKTKIQVMVAITLGLIFFGGELFLSSNFPYHCAQRLITLFSSLAAASATPTTKERAIAFIFLGAVAIGWNESVTLTLCGIVITNQQELGTALGVAGSLRSAISTVAATVYTVVLTNRLQTTIPAQVPPVVVEAGLPKTSVESFLEAFAVGTPAAFKAVKGITPEILEKGTEAYKYASADAYRTVFLTTIAFSGVAVIVSFFVPNVEDRMTGEVAATLHGRKEEVVGTERTERT
ncbi:MAG: hypothetical protein M1812_001155 [Candelaria pacifica]|nr:MAG: hypothetical protein M1812_001155 [Candelaria pacifica]